MYIYIYMYYTAPRPNRALPRRPVRSGVGRACCSCGYYMIIIVIVIVIIIVIVKIIIITIVVIVGRACSFEACRAQSHGCVPLTPGKVIPSLTGDPFSRGSPFVSGNSLTQGDPSRREIPYAGRSPTQGDPLCRGNHQGSEIPGSK